mmetsp:Transcript_17939/g.44796  ORF Transcript_17939/g.44796 Transcript_17939/m.44796 type:complete len:228 (-) Transcript_17939:2003-2686(-)
MRIFMAGAAFIFIFVFFFSSSSSLDTSSTTLPTFFCAAWACTNETRSCWSSPTQQLTSSDTTLRSSTMIFSTSTAAASAHAGTRTLSTFDSGSPSAVTLGCRTTPEVLTTFSMYVSRMRSGSSPCWRRCGRACARWRLDFFVASYKSKTSTARWRVIPDAALRSPLSSISFRLATFPARAAAASTSLSTRASRAALVEGLNRNSCACGPSTAFSVSISDSFSSLPSR